MEPKDPNFFLHTFSSCWFLRRLAARFLRLKRGEAPKPAPEAAVNATAKATAAKATAKAGAWKARATSRPSGRGDSEAMGPGASGAGVPRCFWVCDGVG